MDVTTGGPPPIVQLLLTMQFQPAAASLTILDLADLRRLFEKRLPIFNQVQRAGSMAVYPNVESMPQFGTPRLSMSSEDLASVLLIQDDRITYGWNRLSPLDQDAAYPGFEETLEQAFTYFSQAMDFISERAVETIVPAVGEIAYTDAFIVARQGKVVRPMGDVFTCINSVPDFRFNQISASYWFAYSRENGNDFDGSSETQITGPSYTADDEAIVSLITTVRFPLDELSLTEARGAFGGGRTIAQSLFSKLVKPSAATI